MKLCLADSEDAKAWYLVASKENGLTPICTVSLDLLPPIKETMDIGHVHRRAVAHFADHLADPGELLVFFFNRKTGCYFPVTSRRTADPQAQAKFLEGFAWINTSDELASTDRFLLDLGIEPHHLDRRLASKAARREHVVDVPIPIYGC